MIQVTINNEPKQEASKYPCLMKCKTNGMIVLFHANSKGTCLEPSNTSNKYGEYCEE